MPINPGKPAKVGVRTESPDAMPDRSDLNAAPVSTDAGVGFLELQRAGLHELLTLSAVAVTPTESGIEERYRHACESAEQTLHAALGETEAVLNEKLAAAEKTQAEQTARIEADYAALRAEHADKTRAALERIAAQAHETEAELDRQMEDKLLLADTVAQADHERMEREFGAVEQQVTDGRRRLDALHGRAQSVLSRYGISIPPAGAAPPKPSAPPGDAWAAYYHQAQIALEHLNAIERLWGPRLLGGARLYVWPTLLSALAVGGAWALSRFDLPGAPPFAVSGPVALAVTGLVSLFIGWVIRHSGQARIQTLYGPLARAVAAGGRALDHHLALAQERYQRQGPRATGADRHNSEKAAVRRHFEGLLAEVERRDAEARARLQEVDQQQRAEIEHRRAVALRELSAQIEKRRRHLRERHEHGLATVRKAHRQGMDASRAQYEAERAAQRTAWQAGLERIQRFLAAGDQLRIPTGARWESGELEKPSSADEFAALIAFGRWGVDLTQLAASVRALAGFLDERPPAAATPALLAVPVRCSLLFQTERAGRSQAIDTLRVVMLRLLTALPPGRVRFTIIDPVGLGESFAGFMHLVDYEEALVGGRIWTDSEQIEARLTELTSHMENVIQKYLRNEFATIDAYNRQAGQLAEPYRFLVVADFPTNFTEGAARRLSSIISSGARCGVFTLIMHDNRLSLPGELPLEDLAGGSLHLVHDGERFVAQDELLRQFPLTLDVPPPEEVLTRIMQVVGRGAKDALRVEVPFDNIVPRADQRWTRDAATELTIPIGLAGAVRLQHFRLGRGLAQHVLVAGKTGSGKSTLLHVIITNLALSYRPEEVELYLVDFKKGVEFKTYVAHALPHARAIAIESDREFGVSVLQRLDAEMTRRGDLFRAAGVQDLPAYRAATGQGLPRTLLIVDEFQVFFTEDDKLAQDAAILLDRLVRQGRAFGIHVLLGSQTLAGTAGLARSTMGQMAVRIALQCSEADSQLILDDTNVAARLLSRPGDAIYNDAGGLVAGNNSFQVAWLPDERQSAYLDEVHALAVAREWRGEPAIVFEGNAPADMQQNRLLARLIETPRWPTSVAAPYAWLGEPVAIKDPTGVAFRRQSGANLLFVGQRDDAALAMLAAAMLCLGSQHAPGTARFVILGGAAAGSPAPGGLQDMVALLPHAVQWVDWREVPDALAALAAETQRRLAEGPEDAPAVYILIYGLQRYRVLRRREETFSFSASDADAAPATDRQFVEVLREGPALGLHVLVWSDTLATLERTLDRQTQREFDNRVLFQMSAADSSNLIDSPEANRLGLYRALFFSEERGLLEKFRPYGALDRDWLAHVRQCIERKTAG